MTIFKAFANIILRHKKVDYMTNSVESVWAKVDRRRWNQCWPWTGYRSDGYGRLDIAGIEGVYAHRAAYLSAHPGSIELKDDGSKEQCVLHRCDNPPCCNPRHLFLGSNQDNSDDCVKKGRKIGLKGEASPRAKLTAEDVFWIRMQKKHGATVRALALLHDVSMATISGCLYGRHYQEVISPETVKHSFAQKLSTEDVEQIRRKRRRGVSAHLLAQEYGVVVRSIYRVLHSWSTA
jgi:hypothetical protein